ncbi:Potassium transporter [Polyrhizophydium stewartii]|uniref:Potassium transporter n=1 Tax=Polyrhizophydium stewartii TaxID=2732419 RepID=A0ABR4NGM6_9FUNG
MPPSVVSRASTAAASGVSLDEAALTGHAPLPRLDCVDLNRCLAVSLPTRIGYLCLMLAIPLVPLLYACELVYFGILFSIVKVHNNVQLESYMPAIYSGLLAVSLAVSLILVGFELRAARKIVNASSIQGAALNRLAYFFQSAGCPRRYAFLSKIRNPWDRPRDVLTFFVFFRLQDWKHVIAQLPRQWLYSLYVWYFIIDGNPDRPAPADGAPSDRNVLPNFASASRDMFRVQNMPQLLFVAARFFMFIWAVQAVMLILSVFVYPCLLAAIPKPNLRKYVLDKIDERIDTLLIDMEIESCDRNQRMKI